MPYQRPRTRIGERTERIHIKSLETTDDGMGGQIAANALGWRTIGHAWAKVDGLDERTREALQAQQVTARHAFHFDIDYRTGVLPQMRVEWRNQDYEIHTAAPDSGDKRRLIILASEVQGDA